MKARKRVVIQTAVVLGLLAICASSGFAQRPMRLDERWTVTINGQTAPVLPDGSFRVSNIPVTDFIGDSPGSGPDGSSDEYYQAIATAIINGRTWYASSEPFRLSSQTHTIDDMTIRRTLAHAVPESIRVVTESSLVGDKLFIDGTPNSVVLSVRGTFPGETEERELDGSELARVGYWSSRNAVASVAIGGNPPRATISAGTQVGNAYITASYLGAAAVKRLVVTRSCVDTQLIGRVVDSVGASVGGAIVSTESESESSTLTNSNGTFSFDPCYTPGSPFSVVVIGPGSSSEKALVTGVSPVPGGVTDLGTIVLESNYVFWNKKEAGVFPWSTGANWHTGIAPGSASHAVINVEDRLVPPFEAHTINLNSSVTIDALTIDSDVATLVTDSNASISLVQGATIRRGKVWIKGTGFAKASQAPDQPAIVNHGTLDFGDNTTTQNLGVAVLHNVELINSGAMRVLYQQSSVDRVTSLMLRNGASLVTEASDDLLEINGEMSIENATMTARWPAAGIHLKDDCVPVRFKSGGVLQHDSGVLRVSAGTTCESPIAIFIEPGSKFFLNGGTVSIERLGGITVLSEVGSGPNFVWNGGSIVDQAVLAGFNSHVQIGPDAGPGRIVFRRESSTLRGEIGPGQTITIDTLGSDPKIEPQAKSELCFEDLPAGQGEPDPPDVLMVDGRLELIMTGLDSLDPILRNCSGNGTSDVHIGPEGTLLLSGYPAAETGPRLNARLVNYGVTELRERCWLGRPAGQPVGTHENHGTLRLLGNAVVTLEPPFGENFYNAGTVSGGGQFVVGELTFNNSGRLEIGGTDSAGVLTINGSFNQPTSGTLHIELGGTTPGSYDRLVVTGSVSNLLGSLDVDVLPSYTNPQVGNEFSVVVVSGTGPGISSGLCGAGLITGSNGMLLQPSCTGSTANWSLKLRVMQLTPP